MTVPAENASVTVPLGPDRPTVDWPNKLLFQLPGNRLTAILSHFQQLTGHDLGFTWLPNSELAVTVVNHPPTLWRDRLLDEARHQPEIKIFREWAAGVWIEMGFVPEKLLPASYLTRPTNQQVLIRYPGELVEIGLIPEQPAPLNLRAIPVQRRRLQVPAKTRLTPKLTTRESTESPTLWIVDQDALGQLSNYCRTAGEVTLGLFEIAVTTVNSMPTVLVRSRTSRRDLSIFSAHAKAFIPWQKKSNLFIPKGRRLVPSLRRDITLQAFNLQAGRLYWIAESEATWRLESINADAFQPLSQWVTYRSLQRPIHHETWFQSDDWQLEGFAVNEAKTPEKQRDYSSVARREKRDAKRKGLLARAVDWLKSARPAEKIPDTEPPSEIPVEDAVRTAMRQSERLHHARPESGGGLAERCQQLEIAFYQRIEQPEQNLGTAWSELAAAYDAADNSEAASICWLNALWADRSHPALWSWGWLRASAREAHLDARLADPVAWLEASPNAHRTRALAAWVVWAARQSPTPEGLTRRVAELQTFLRTHEHWLPVRAAWLAQSSLAKFTRGDVLSLARTRDRLVERLHGSGLSLELDTPAFLRFGDEESRHRHHDTVKWLEEKRRPIHRWVNSLTSKLNPTSASKLSPALLENGLEPERVNTIRYIDLLIGWGLTRLSESVRAKAILVQADESFPNTDPVHGMLREAFEFRIQQLREGRSGRTPLPPEWHTRRETLRDWECYFVDKFCEVSRVLQPNPPPSAYLEAIFQKVQQSGPSTFSLNRLNTFLLNEKLPELLRKAVAERGPSVDFARMIISALRRITELNSDSLEAVFAAIPVAIDSTRSAPTAWVGLLEHGLAAASFADRPDLARLFVNELLSPTRGVDFPENLAAQAFRSLRRMGLRSDAERVLHFIATSVTQGASYGKLRKTRPVEWPSLLRTMLHVAAGWYYAGRDDQAFAVLEEAKVDLFDSETSPVNRTRLALAYVHTLGQAPFRVALGRLDELFQRLTGLHVGGTANRYFCLPVIQLVEASVRAVVADDLAAGPGVRSWLDADEFAVRQRIRDELAESLTKIDS